MPLVTIEQQAFDAAFKARLTALKVIIESGLFIEKKVHLSYKLQVMDIVTWSALKADAVADMHTLLEQGSLPTDFQRGREFFAVLDKEIDQYSEQLTELHKQGVSVQWRETRKRIMIGVTAGLFFIISCAIDYFS